MLRRWPSTVRERRVIRIERAYSRRALKQPKSEAGVRTVPLFASVGEALRYVAARAVERGRYAPDELVFARARGTSLHESNFNRRVWRPALEHAGLAELGYRFHDLRHTCVSRLVGAGADIKLVHAVAGHASPQITLKRCSHLLDTRISEAADRFDPAGFLDVQLVRGARS
jgi:integrase